MADLEIDIPAEQLMTLDALNDLAPNVPDGEIILDVRRPDEFAAGHIKGAINFSHEVVGNHVDALKQYSKIYIHCQRGRRAQYAYDTLSKAGFSNLVCITDDGIQGWKQKGYPLVTE